MPDPTHDTQPHRPAQDDQPSEELALPRWRQWNTPSNWLIAVFVVLAALPAVRMVNLVRQATATQYSDYWPMFSSVFNFDGSLNVRGIFEFRNVHSLVTAKLLYWINFQISGGSNNILGYIVVAFVIAQVVLVYFLVRRSRNASIMTRGIIVVTASLLLFARHGTWNFMHSMSGAAWLTANFFVIAAIVAEGPTPRRRVGSFALGIAASLSYGTGLMVWPALLVAATIRDRKIWRHWLIVIGGVASVLWYQYQPLAPGAVHHGKHGAVKLEKALTVLGASLAGGSTGRSIALAVLVIVGGIVAGIFVIRKAPAQAAPWIGLWTYGLLASAFIGFGRRMSLERLVLSGRYSSLGSFAILGAIALVLLSIPQVGKVRWGVFAFWLLGAIAVWQSGATEARQELAGGARWDDLAILQRLDLADGLPRWLLFEKFPRITAQMENMGHYPFNDNFTLDCGTFGTTIHPRGITDALPSGITGRLSNKPEIGVARGARRIRGYLTTAPECIVATDATGKVIGVGRAKVDVKATQRLGPPNAVQLVVYTRLDESPTQYLVKFPHNDRWYVLAAVERTTN